jgi:hypothetical protein
LVLLFSPTGFDTDTLSPDGINRTIAKTVSRDNGNVASASDWFTLCESSIGFVGLFIDTSGSMTLSTVTASYNKFVADLEREALAYAQVFNRAEDFIVPFLTTLVPSS